MDLSTIRTFARQKADETETDFVDNTELNRYVNQGLRFVYGKIVQRFENYFITQGTTGNGGKFDTVSGTQGYALPTDLMKLVRVEHRPDNSTNEDAWLALRTLNIANDGVGAFYPPREGYGAGYGLGYFIAGNTIYLRPTPNHVYEVRLWYIPRVTVLSADGDTPVVPTEYHELIAEYAAIQMLAKSGENIWKERTDVFQAELANMLETIEMRNQQSEQMVITDETGLDTMGFSGL